MKVLITIILLFNLIGCYSQDSFIEKDETGRYMNVSLTNYEVRAIELAEKHITLESLNGEKLTFEIVERNKAIIKVRYKDQIRFFEIQRNKIIIYQRTNHPEPTIIAYKKGNNSLKNTFKKISLNR